MLPALPGFAQPAAPTPKPSALNNGSKEEASKYYKELSTRLGLLTPATIEAQADMKSLLSYLGYGELTPEEIEFAEVEALRKKSPSTPEATTPFVPGSVVSLQSDTGLWFARCRGCQRSRSQDTVTVHVKEPSPAYARFTVVDAGNGQVALKADTGQFVARCRSCIYGGTTPDSVTIHVSGSAPPPAYARFTPERLPNGKFALKADTGKYLGRCRSCSRGAAVPDTVTIHVTDPKNSPWAQWTVVQQTPSKDAPSSSQDDILVSRFFAPKIVNFAVPPAERAIGWRRLVRLNSRPGSEAKKHFVESAWILFNHFTQPPKHSPFGGTAPTRTVKPSPWGDVEVTTPGSMKNGSVNTQVGLVTHCPESNESCKDLNSIYWVDFGASAKGYKLSYQLDAFFDAGALGGAAPYFVPNGCDTCHGSLRGNAVLNHLDTDHWIDRVADGDFPALAAPDAPAPLFDAGKNTKTPQYAAAFEVLRKMNAEIGTMQQRVHEKSFHLAATRKWLEMHKSSDETQTNLVARSFDFFNEGSPLKKTRKPEQGPINWTSSKEDQETLGLLNMYCYRCHGAIRFNVYSKDMVADQADAILGRIDPNPTQKKILGFQMPPDRDMPEKDRQRLIELIEKLYDETHK